MNWCVIVELACAFSSATWRFEWTHSEEIQALRKGRNRWQYTLPAMKGKELLPWTVVFFARSIRMYTDVSVCNFYWGKKSTGTLKWPRDKTLQVSLVGASSSPSPSSLLSLLLLLSRCLLRNGNSRKTSRRRITLMTLFRLQSPLFFCSRSLSLFLFFCL